MLHEVLFLRDGDAARLPASVPVRLADGSQAEFAPASKATIAARRPDIRAAIELAQGAGTFKVVPGAGEGLVDPLLGDSDEARVPPRDDEGERREGNLPRGEERGLDVPRDVVHGDEGLPVDERDSLRGLDTDEERAHASLPSDVITIFERMLSGKLMPRRIPRLRGSATNSVEACGGGGGVVNAAVLKAL